MYKRLLFCVMILLCTIGCQSKPPVYNTYKIDNIEQVIQISPCHYRFAYVDKLTNEVMFKDIQAYHCKISGRQSKISIFADVDKSDQMYITVTKNGIRLQYDVHIHSIHSIKYGITSGKHPEQQTPLVTPEKEYVK